MPQTMGLHVIRKVEGLTQATINYLAQRENFDPDASPWISNDAVRDSDYNIEIVDSTTGFAIADEDGKIIKLAPSLSAAYRMMAGAKVVFTTDVDVEDEDDVATDEADDLVGSTTA